MNNAALGGLVFIAFSLFMLSRCIKSLNKSKLSLKWPNVEGRILKSETVRWQSTSNNKTLFVEYEYQVDGKNYRGETVAFYTLTGQEADKLDKQFKSNPLAPIFYDPDDPSEARLVIGPRTDKEYSDVILSILGLFIGVLVFIAAYLEIIG